MINGQDKEIRSVAESKMKLLLTLFDFLKIFQFSFPLRSMQFMTANAETFNRTHKIANYSLSAILFY